MASPPPLPVLPSPFASSSPPSPPHAEAIEVAALLGDSVVHVAHCVDPRARGVRRATWVVLAAGAACVLAAGLAFATAVSTAAANQAALDHHTRVLQRPAYAFRPHRTSPALPWVASVGLALGLAALTAGLARSRRERRRPDYRIGTAPGVDQPLAEAPAASFPLIAPAGDHFELTFAPGIDGELLAQGVATPFAAVPGAHASDAAPGARAFAIPADARIRVRAGRTAFAIAAIARPRAQPTSVFAGFDRRLAGYAAGSLALHLAALAVLAQVPPDDGGANIALGVLESAALRGAQTTQESAPPPPPEPSTGGSDGEAGGEPSATAMGLEGTAGTPAVSREAGRLTVERRAEDPQLARARAIREAESAGILGSTEALRRNIASMTSPVDWDSGFDDASIYGAVFGASGEGAGSFGLGRRGISLGGGCEGSHCGVIGTGHYATTPHPGGRGGPGDWPFGRGGGPRLSRTAAVPTVVIRPPTTASDGLDRAIIKRYVARSVEKIKYCYERELLARSGLEGTIAVQFMIGPTGTVTAAHGSGFDPTIATCVAGVIRTIEFPRPRTDSTVQVNYPFTFRAPS